ncbi:hypothetical protein CDCA_CDCA09G2818 [Cyanidium caldarium]|uniref:MHD domain-containing protein n=1 Tax=Cyanidium caldarium TaxID=2771 RepID=A0AAV9IYB6_CYACA|nr:hypothetical protein CDCA_CDCA09G2818 [Cyanidium caldarium]
MSVSAVLIVDSRGRLLIARDYCGDVDVQAAAQAFASRLGDHDAPDTAFAPVMAVARGDYYLSSVRHQDVYLVAVQRSAYAAAATAIAFLHSLLSVLMDYLRRVNEESVRDNFVVIYELLDELMDYGYPQTTESKLLREYILQDDAILSLGLPSASSSAATQPKPPTAVTQSVSWRPEGIRHHHNEVFLDVIEAVSMVLGPQGNVLRAEVNGRVMIKCFLSGMPELKLGLNDKLQLQRSGNTAGGGGGTATAAGAVELEDVKFHQCVRLDRFESERVILFVPPDGEFELMTYRVSGAHIKPLFLIDSTVEMSAHKMEYLVRARSQYPSKHTANKVRVYVPAPEDADSPRFKASLGRVKYVPERDALLWQVKHFPGSKEAHLQGAFGLPSVAGGHGRQWAVKRPVQMQFEIPYFTVSGLQVRYLKVWSREGYTSYPWVRYVTEAGDYEVRLM